MTNIQIAYKVSFIFLKVSNYPLFSHWCQWLFIFLNFELWVLSLKFIISESERAGMALWPGERVLSQRCQRSMVKGFPAGALLQRGSAELVRIKLVFPKPTPAGAVFGVLSFDFWVGDNYCISPSHVCVSYSSQQVCYWICEHIVLLFTV